MIQGDEWLRAYLAGDVLHQRALHEAGLTLIVQTLKRDMNY